MSEVGTESLMKCEVHQMHRCKKGEGVKDGVEDRCGEVERRTLLEPEYDARKLHITHIGGSETLFTA